MRLRVWGARGSVAAPGPETTRYGGNTSCLEVTLGDGTIVVLDAGTGIRGLGLALARRREVPEIHILLTHLHLDHIQGLVFFAPCFDAGARIVIHGPPDPGDPDSSLEERIGRYISAPLSPVEVRELPCEVSFRDCPGTEWRIGSATVCAAAVTHRGPTLGYRVSEGAESLCYIPDHEPAIGAPVQELEPEWISGYDLASRASLLVHDCQYTDAEYPRHIGWGHSRMSDALAFARRTEAKRVLLFHHDPLHTDAMLDAFAGQAAERWSQLGGSPADVSLAVEGSELELGALQAADSAGGSAPACSSASSTLR